MTFEDSKETVASLFIFRQTFRECDENILHKLKEYCIFLYIIFHDASSDIMALKMIRSKINDNFANFDPDSAIITLWHWALQDSIIRICQLLDQDKRNETASLPFISYKITCWKEQLNLEDVSGLHFTLPAEFSIIKDLRHKVLIHVDPKQFGKIVDTPSVIDYITALETTLTNTIEPWFGTIMNTFFEKPARISIEGNKANNLLKLLDPDD